MRKWFKKKKEGEKRRGSEQVDLYGLGGRAEHTLEQKPRL